MSEVVEQTEQFRSVALAIADEIVRQATPDTVRARSGLQVTINEHALDAAKLAAVAMAASREVPVRDEPVTFEYEKLGNRWCHFDTDEDRQAMIDIVLADIRAYLNEGYDGDGDGWAPRDWSEVNRLASLVYAVRDLRWKRDADGQGGIDINLSPRALGDTYDVFVPRDPELLRDSAWRYGQRKGDPEPTTELEKLEWALEVLRKSDMLLSYGNSVAQRARTTLEMMTTAKRAEEKFQASFESMLSFIEKEAETSLAAQKAYLDLMGTKSLDEDRYKRVFDAIWARFADVFKDEGDALLARIDDLAKAAMDRDEYYPQANELAEAIVSFQTRCGFVPASVLRARFNRVGEKWRDKKGKATGLPITQWWKNGVLDAIRVGMYQTETEYDLRRRHS